MRLQVPTFTWTVDRYARPVLCGSSSHIGRATAFEAEIRLLTDAEARELTRTEGSTYPRLRQAVNTASRAWASTDQHWRPGEARDYAKPYDEGRYYLSVIIRARDLSDARNGDYEFASAADRAESSLDMGQRDRSWLDLD